MKRHEPGRPVDDLLFHTGRRVLFGESREVKVSLPLIVVVASGLLVSLWLLNDAMAFGLHPADPATGRARGCYTSIELLFGLKTPSGWVRPVEFGIGIMLFIGSVIAIAKIFTRRFRR